MILAHLLDYMMLKTVFTAKHSATLWAHAGAIMPFLVFDALLTNFAVVAAA